MKAMVLAAGLGTRLRPLTNDRPKALVEVAGRAMLDLTLARLREYGIHDVIVNTHHFADLVAGYLAANQNFGMHIEISREEELLDTGGGLKQVGWFFQDSEEPFLLHNVDIVSNIDIAAMLRQHIEHKALATLATQHRTTSRYLLFDQQGALCGRQSVPKSGEPSVPELIREVTHSEPRAFAGIHIISPHIFSKMTEEGAFSIIPAYLRLAGQGERIQSFNADAYRWRYLGTPESILQAAQDLEQDSAL